MTEAGELIRLVRAIAEAGFGIRVHGCRVLIVGAGQPSQEFVTGLRRLKPAALTVASEMTWRCQTLLWPARVHTQYMARVRAFEQAGFGFDEGERLAYPEFAAYNVFIVCSEAPAMVGAAGGAGAVP